MNPRSRIRVFLVVATLLAIPPAAAAPCSQFTDVDSTHPFCPHVDWLRNRAITLGCTTTTLFCPLNPVTRLSMAAFMNRLGVALTPAVLYDADGGTSLDLGAPPTTVCQTPQVDAAVYPRSVHAGAVFSAFTGATTARLTLVQSIDDGPWVALNTAPSTVGGLSKWINATAWRGNVPLSPGASYRFGLRVDSATGAGAVSDWTCQLRAIVVNRTGSSVPF